MKTKRIETYSLFEFCQSVQESVIEGWRFDFDSNELFPTAFGSMLVTGMVKAEDTDVSIEVSQDNAEDNIEPVIEDNTEDNIEPVIEDNTQVKRGRKPKDSI